jgi:hypothetical protein
VGTSSLYDVIDSATCKNCGTSIPPKAKVCSGCGASGPEARTSKAKSSSLDNLLLFLAVLLFAGLFLTFVGTIPVLIMIVGAVLAFRSGDVKNMKVTARFVQVIVILGALICGFITLSKQDDVEKAAPRMQAAESNMNWEASTLQPFDFAQRYSPDEQAKIFRADREYDDARSSLHRSEDERNEFMACAGGIGSVALIIEFLWIGPLTRQLPVWRAARSHKKTTATKARIIGRDSLTPYSIADELLKWNKLREDGLITEDEYQEARMNLLNRR